jgi:hypothetical protein
MDSEVRRAKQHVRAREAAVWNRVETIGRQARAAGTKAEQQSVTTKADDDKRRERHRMAP